MPTQVNQDRFRQHLEGIADFFDDPQEPLFYHRDLVSQLREILTDNNGQPRLNWPSQNRRLASLLRQLAQANVQKLSDDQWTVALAQNYATLVRTAAILQGYNGGPVMLSDVDLAYWQASMPDESALMDYQQIQQGFFTDNMEDITPEEEEESESILVRVQDMLEYIPMWVLGLALVVVLGLLGTQVWRYFNPPAYQPPAVTQTQPPQGQENPGIDLSGQNGQQPEGAPLGVPEISTDVQNLQQKVDLVASVVTEQAFAILLLLALLALAYVMLDRKFDLETEDFQILLIGLIVYVVGIALPLGAWFFPTTQVTYFGNYLQMSPEIMADIILTIIFMVALASASYAGVPDATVFSGGALIMGIVIFIMYPQSFFAWAPPLLSFGIWGVGLFAHVFFSLLPEHKVKLVFGLVAVAAAVQVMGFLFLLQEFSTSTTATFFNNAQAWAFGFSTVAVDMLLIVALVANSFTSLVREDGRLHNVIQTAAFDAAILLKYVVLILLVIVWA